MLITYFGHHKAASNWIAKIMHELAEHYRWRTELVHNFLMWPGYATLGDRVRAERLDLLMHTNARQEDIDTLPEFRGFHVIRDPRDIIVSGYFSHLYSHPEDGWPALRAHRTKLQELDVDAGLLLEIEWSHQFLDFISTWRYDQPNVLELRLEDMLPDPVQSWRMILGHLQIDDLPEGRIEEIVEKYSFERLSGGRARGQEDKSHHYRRGTPGDWRNYLNADHLETFDKTYGDLIQRLGYA